MNNGPNEEVTYQVNKLRKTKGQSRKTTEQTKNQKGKETNHPAPQPVHPNKQSANQISKLPAN